MRILSLLCLLWSGMLFGQSTDSLFQAGNQAYQAQNYNQALKYYTQALEQTPNSPELLTNTGLAYLATQELGEAVWHFEQALRWDTNYAPAQHNLRVARQSIEGAEVDPQTFLPFYVWRTIRDSLSADIWALFFVLLLFVGVGIWYFARLQKWIKKSTAAYILWSVSLLPLLFAIQRAGQRAPSSYSVLIQPKAGMRSGPSLSFPEQFVVQGGRKVERLATKEGWIEVQLLTGERGWLPEKSLRALR